LRTALHAYKDIFPREAPPPTVEQLTELWARSLQSDANRAFVWDEDGAVTGAVLSGPDPDDDAVGHLSRLYVEPSSWGRGIGRALYDACIAHLDASGYIAVTLWVLERNHRVREWYERLGWELMSKRRTIYAPAGIDDVHYRLRLTP
jgi:ribosomal protein S18 acetylase RimI-like enzyme